MELNVLKIFNQAKKDFHYIAEQTSEAYDYLFYLEARLMAKAAIDCKKLGLV